MLGTQFSYTLECEIHSNSQKKKRKKIILAYFMKNVKGNIDVEATNKTSLK